MQEFEMRRVILDRAHSGPDGIDPLTGRCKCPTGLGDDECIHRVACRWNVQVHSPSNYEVRHHVCDELKAHGRSDLAEIFGKASLGLTGPEMQKLWSVLKKGFHWS